MNNMNNNNDDINNNDTNHDVNEGKIKKERNSYGLDLKRQR